MNTKTKHTVRGVHAPHQIGQQQESTAMNNERYAQLRDMMLEGFNEGIDPMNMAQRMMALDVTKEEAAELMGRLLREGELGKLHESIQDQNKAEMSNVVPIHTESGRKL
jgi:hypothetical protein